ncbi:pyruvate ferredoxin oxidoreductase [Adlercreutzia sp. R21]|uniref:pyruvate ferredoxin oxidoreductase n=1 Tax=Adlercreutzia wanghongyangiae TaxID=3111451 RepID=UPI002DB6BF02|nr:pyruvate ferredoxin oxidoreductase [Adlercreutzia sp. R21]MEC4183464.1 pyruvate ferredoxin oxidoreductase [Adlercreutzia sp. R21]
MRKFLSGNEAFAEGVRLARPQVISAYPITPQTTVVEALASMVEEGSLTAEYLHVESEHTALAAAIGAAATGARTFTATSSQGLLYMAECLTYASGGRFPIVMMNANRALALPWNIYGDQRDSLSLLDHGWIQVYAQDNQEALDLALMAYAVAEDARVSLPVMVNVDGFALTHTYESVEIPTADEADAFLPPYVTENRFSFERPVNIGYSAGPDYNSHYQYWHHRDMLAAETVIGEVEARFAEVCGRAYPGMVEAYRTEDADFVLVTLGSVAGLARDVVGELRAAGTRAGLLRIRYLRPMPARQVAEALTGVRAVGVLEQDISFGFEGTVFTNVMSALARTGSVPPALNFIGGLGGADISRAQMRGMYGRLAALAAGEGDVGVSPVVFLDVDGVPAGGLNAAPTRDSEAAAGSSVGGGLSRPVVSTDGEATGSGNKGGLR